MWDASDEALLAGFATGDQTAEAAFVRRFQRRLYGVAVSLVGESDAADVAQEAFVRAWRHADAFDPRRGSVAMWLSTITRNLALDHLRARRARPSDPVDPVALVMRATAPGPEDRALLGDDTGRAVAALRGLPSEQRRALVLAALGGRTAREVGQIDGVPLGTAKTRIRTALLRMREVLADDEVSRG